MIPPIPLREIDGTKLLAPGEKFAILENNPLLARLAAQSPPRTGRTQ